MLAGTSALVAFSEAHNFGWASWKTLGLIAVSILVLFNLVTIIIIASLPLILLLRKPKPAVMQ